jgi:ribosomal protein S18 acetylase RimI-like enzyme
MQPDWDIRTLEPEDVDLVLQADVFDGPARRDWARRTLGAVGQPDPRNLLLVAVRKGTVVGFVSGTIINHPDKPPTLFINELGVNAPAQRLGIGSALLQAIRHAGRQRGCLQSWVATEADNAAARALYRAAGGKETPDIVMYDWEEASDA